MERKLAVITGADGGMGTEITRAVALAGYRVIMACCNREKAEGKREWLVKETGNPEVEVMYIDLASLASVADFAERLCARGGETGIADEQCRDDGNRSQADGGWTGTYGECELCGALFVDTQVTSTNGRGEQSGQHGVVYVCNRTAGFPGLFLARKEGEFLANTGL